MTYLEILSKEIDGLEDILLSTVMTPCSKKKKHSWKYLTGGLSGLMSCEHCKLSEIQANRRPRRMARPKKTELMNRLNRLRSIKEGIENGTAKQSKRVRSGDASPASAGFAVISDGACTLDSQAH
ncbi:MAG: hypothetical protein K2X27_06715 [Candidatus Obscuribacterales bacterium]|nr:hypothetical protein [Candidatus Obscuribacterales bacterium]